MNTFPFSVVISDLDGTLLLPNHRLGEFTLNTLQSLISKGVPFLVATGRPFQDVQGIFRHTSLSDLLCITSNGARIDRLDGENLYLNPLPNDLAKALTTLDFDESQVSVSIYEEKGWFVNVDWQELNSFHHVSGFFYQVADFHQHEFSLVEKVFFLAKESEWLKSVENTILTRFAGLVKLTYSTPFCLEVMNQSVSKATALQHILPKEILERAIAFGDGLNDVEMLSVVGKGCVMGNADPRLTEQLPELERIGQNIDEAVAYYLMGKEK